ncbi:MAG TPA: PilZ domain-containing protein [Pseudomonas sp.]|nr:PilZ domain-containing protein [Pseudomonas sp.]
MRRFLRHPSDMPVELVQRKHAFLPRQRLNNISLGGVACNSQKGFRKGTAVELRIPLLGDQACYPGVVAWCRKQPGDYLVGIAFIDEETLFRARMVEQVCQIEHYRHQRELELGQAIPVETVACEWIALHAAEFSSASLSSL